MELNVGDIIRITTDHPDGNARIFAGDLAEIKYVVSEPDVFYKVSAEFYRDIEGHTGYDDSCKHRYGWNLAEDWFELFVPEDDSGAIDTSGIDEFIREFNYVNG